MKTLNVLKAMVKLEEFRKKHGDQKTDLLSEFAKDRDIAADNALKGIDPNCTDIPMERVDYLQERLRELNAAFHEKVGEQAWQDSKDYFKFVWDGWLEFEEIAE